MRWFTESRSLLALLAAALLIIALPTATFAQGTPAGTQIENSASVTYQDQAGVAQPPITSNTVTVTVSQVAAVSTAPATAASSAAAGATNYYAFTVTNTGNGTDTFALGAVSGHNPAWTVSVIKDDGAGGGTANDGIRQSGETHTASTTGALAAEASFHGFLAVTIPSDAADGASDTETLTAQSQFDQARTAALVCTTTAQNAVFSITKAADLDSAAPGDTITYTLAYSNAGSASATNVVITDTVPSEVAYLAGSVTLNGASKTDAADGDEVTVSGGVITVNLGTVAAGAQGTIVFRVTVN